MTQIAVKITIAFNGNRAFNLSVIRSNCTIYISSVRDERYSMELRTILHEFVSLKRMCVTALKK